MKKIFFALLFTMLTFHTSPLLTQAAEQKTFGDVTYKIVTKSNSAREVHITGFNKLKNNIVIPARIEGLPVVEIADRAFYIHRSDDIDGTYALNELSGSITSVTLPNTLNRIGNEAFANHRIKKIKLPNSVKEIGYAAFAHNDLTHITIPKSVQTIGGNIVLGNPIKTYNLPAHFKQPIAKESGKLLYTTFTRYGKKEVRITGHTYNTAQTKILVPQKIQNMPVTEIGDYAFTNDASLLGLKQDKPAINEVVLPSTIRKIGDHALAGVSYDNNSKRSFSLPESLEVIGNYAFAGSGLTNHGQSLKLPLKLKTIGDGAFQHNHFKSVTIPFHVKTLGKYAFAYNDLTTVIFGNSVKTIPTGAFLANDITHVTLPQHLVAIGDAAFMQNHLPRLDLPTNVQSIGDAAFAYNDLTSVNLAKVHTIGDGAFVHNALTVMNVPSQVEYMPMNAIVHNPLQMIKFQGAATKLLDYTGTYNVGSKSYADVHGQLEKLTTDPTHTKPWTKWNNVVPARTTLYVKWR